MAKISLDQIMSERQFSIHKTDKGDALFKINKAPATWNAEERSAIFCMTAEITDRYGDVVVSKGGILTDFVNNPVALWAHNSRNFPIGMWSDLKVFGGQRKRMEGKNNLSPEGTTPDGDTVARLLAANMVRACSIGFMPTEWEAIDKENPWNGYKFLEWELWECSVCSIPANPAALVKAAGGDAGLALQAIELVLDEWARTPAGTIVPRAVYEKAYKVQKDTNTTILEVRAIEEEDEPAVVEPAAPEAPVDIVKAVDDVLAKREDTMFAKFAKLFGLKVTAPVVEETVDPATAAVDPATPALDPDPAFAQQVADELERDLNLADEQDVLQARARAQLLMAD